MKPKLSIGVCVMISLALVLFGLLYGTVSGFSDDRRQATDLLSGENGLLDVLSYRGADGLNLCVVARRHLPTSDPDVAALETAAQNLRAEKASLVTRRQEDERLEAAAQLVGQKLRATPSFQDSQRDQAYLDMLTTDMQQLSRSAVIEAYNQAAEDFNTQLDKPFSGTIARLLGVKPCQLYQ